MVKLKVCGMKYIENIKSIADLKPDYMGFVMYHHSKRNFEGLIPQLPKNIKKTGVFVNELMEVIVSLVEEYQLDAVQLHGDETIDYIRELKGHLTESIILKKRNLAGLSVEIIKAFGVKDQINFEDLQPYENEIDYFLFDTKGKERGGNGVAFDWSLLKEYPFSKPFFLSGGIQPNDGLLIKKIEASGLPIYAVDINSNFEEKPGFKNIKKVKNFKNNL